MNVFTIDAIEFSRLNERNEGEIALADFSRLSKECVTTDGSIQWSLQGSIGKFSYPQLTLTVSGVVQLVCQRCLTPLEFKIDSESVLVLAPDEGRADEMEALLDDENVDVIIASKTLNVLELIEDEALLALPLSTKHTACPDSVLLQEHKNQKESQFAILKTLKSH